VAPGHPTVHGGEQLSLADGSQSRSRRVEPIRAARLSWLFFRLGVMNEMQYRVNFFIQLLQSLLAVGTGLAVLALVFSHTKELKGWSPPELLAVMGVHLVMGGLIRTTIQPNMTRLIEDIRQGTLDYALTKPEDAQLMVSVRDIRLWQGVDILVGAIVLAVAIVRIETAVGVGDALGFAAALILGGLMIYCFWLILTIGAFWVVRMDQIVELFEGVYQAGRWPVNVYPLWLRTGLTFLVPIAFAVTVPAQGVTSRLNGATLLAAVGLAVALLAVTRWFWKFGLRRYSGASA
jgi:ABC-2 type transport system permease protein